jgi:diaminopimelate epimerase
VKRVWCYEDGDVTVDMGVPQVLGMGKAQLAGRAFEGLRISMGNPHLACVTNVALDPLDLSVSPEVDPGDFPDGANVELVQVVDRTHLRMRVHERGVGETDSCGTGAVAAAIAGAAASGMDGGEFTIDVAGGRLTVRLDGPRNPAFLTGPAVLVARGEWLVGS